MRALAASSALTPVLGPSAGTAMVVASHRRAAYLEHEGGMVGVEVRGGARLPISVVVDDLPRGDTTVDLTTLRPHRWWDPSVPRLRSCPPRRIVERLRAPLPPPADAGERAVEAALRSGEPADLVGLGPGSTPAGDDVLAGRLVALHALGAGEAAVALGARLPLRRTTSLSAELLRHAVGGRAAGPLRRLLRALARDEDPEPGLAQVLSIGATSGIWLLRGLLDVFDGSGRAPHGEVATDR